MKHKLRIRIKTNHKSKTLLKLHDLNLSMQNISYSKEYLTFDTSSDDLKRIKKYLVSYQVEVLDELGVYKVKKEIRKNSLFLISILFGIIMFFFLSNIIVKVNVIHEDKKIREILTDALKERGVTPLSFKKSYDDYEKIIEEIKSEYKDKIEWLEIDVDGMIIDVRVEERIMNHYEKEYSTCHIVASKSGVIKSILTEKGVAEVRLNDFVKKDDILINGEIKLNEEVKNNVCASGQVYAEVWYNVNTTLPLNYSETTKTGKMRYNLMIKNGSDETIILKSRVGEDKTVENKKLFQIFGFTFYLQKEYEVEINKKTYSEEEALEKSKEIIREKLDLKLDDFEEIIEEKVLKKSLNNGNLYIDMFVAVKEQIGVRKYYQVEMDRGTNDEANNGNTGGIN